MKQPNPIDVEYVKTHHNINKERNTIKAGVHVGTIPAPSLFSFSTTMGGNVPLNTITQEANTVAVTIKQNIRDLIEAHLGRDVSTNDLKRIVFVSVCGSGKLHVTIKVARLETDTECTMRLIQQARMRRVAQECKNNKSDKHIAAQKEYALYRKLKTKYEFNVSNLMEQIHDNNS